MPDAAEPKFFPKINQVIRLTFIPPKPSDSPPDWLEGIVKQRGYNNNQFYLTLESGRDLIWETKSETWFTLNRMNSFAKRTKWVEINISEAQT